MIIYGRSASIGERGRRTRKERRRFDCLWASGPFLIRPAEEVRGVALRVRERGDELSCLRETQSIWQAASPRGAALESSRLLLPLLREILE